MSLEFDYYCLGDLVKIKYGKNQKNVQDDEKGQYPIFGTGGLMGYSIKYLYDKPSVLIGRKGSIEKVRYIEEPFWTVDTLFYTEVNENIVIPKFLYYMMSLMDLNRYNEGTSIPSLRTETLNRLEFPIPDLIYQKRVLSILSRIDKKISINEKLNNNLENLLMEIFKSWFIYFEKYDKSNGMKIDESYGELPKLWSVEMLEDYVDFVTGVEPGSKNYHENPEVNDVPFLRVGDLGSRESTVFIDESLSKNKILTFEDIVLSLDATIGIVKIGLEGAYSTGMRKLVIKNNNINKPFLYCLIKSERIQKIIETFATGTTILHAGKSIKHMNFVLSDKYTMDKFAEIGNPILSTILSNLKEIEILTNMRDTLLPKLMSGEIDVSKINCDLKLIIKKNHIKIHKPYYMEDYNMKTKIISKIQNQMKPFLNQGQYLKLTNSLLNSFKDIEILDNNDDSNESDNNKLLTSFLSAKQVEGRSEKTLIYYKSTLEKMLEKINKQVYNITTDDIRKYLYEHKQEKNSSKITIDNIRRIFSSFFSWLEDEDYILKNPVRRIHRVKTGRVVKEVLTDENLEILRDQCKNIRDLALIEILISTGIRVGELVKLNIDDIDFYERECVVFGKGESERIVYFDARTKIHLIEYLESRNDENPALFVSLNKPNKRLGISGIETRLRELGKKCNIPKVHPHKFRRTLATNAIDKGMPIEQVQKLLGHVQIDTTMQYAMVNQSNVKIAHRKFIS